MTKRHVPTTLAALAALGLLGASCREWGAEYDDPAEEPPPAAQDEFNYEDVNDSEAAIDDSLRNLGWRDRVDAVEDEAADTVE